MPTVPNFSLMPTVVGDAFALAIVVFAISVSMGKILARKEGYEIDSNQVCDF
jgi:MFS superfamily sulfate permease-like transporter